MIDKLKALYEELKNCPKCAARRAWIKSKIDELEAKLKSNA